MVLENHNRLQQVTDYVCRYIAVNGLVEGDQLPSEATLAKELGVSRNTVREGYIRLEADGILTRKHGFGTFLKRNPIILDQLGDFSSYTQRIKTAGYQLDHRIVAIEQVTAPTPVYDSLKLKGRPQLLCVRRILGANDVPVVYIVDHFTARVKQEHLDWERYDGDMVEFFGASIGITNGSIYSHLCPVIADKEIASYIGVDAGTAIINSRGVIYSVEGEPLIATSSYLNPSMIELESTRAIRFGR